MAKFKSKKVLSSSNLPSKLPIWPSIVCWMALDHWDAPQWLYGAMGLLFLVVWAASIVGLATEEKVDLFEDDDNKEA